MHGLIFRWVGEAFRAYPGRVSLLLLLSLLGALMEGLSISMLIPLIATLFEGSGLLGSEDGIVAEALGRVAAIAGPAYRLEFIAGLIVALVALRALIGFINSVNVARLAGQLSFDMRARIHANLLGVDYQYICVTDNGRLINTLDGETWKVTEAIFGILNLFSYACMVLALGTVLLLISWPLTLLVAVLVVLVTLIRRLADPRARRLGERKVAASEDLSIRSYELLDSMRMTRAFGQEAKVQQAYEASARRLVELDVELTRLDSGISTVQEVLYAAIVAILLLSAVAMGLGEASLIAFLALLHRIQPNLMAIDQTRTSLIESFGSVAAVSELLGLRPWSDRASGSRRIEQLEHGIAFEEVTFSYQGKAAERRNALESVSFSIPFGKTTALVGASGAGKSTITNLLLRLHDPEQGRITVDGVPLNELDLVWWRARLAISGQDTGLLSGTLRENIAYANPQASAGEIEQAARAAQIHDFILQLPLGYETHVGERGLLLSGGQRQRIELARALLRKDAILILDEATNALDSMTESEVLKAFRTVAGDRTIVIIAHRLSTTREADHVVVLAHGNVAEAGAPAALYQSGGLFRKMVELQELSHLVNDPAFLADKTGRPLSAIGGKS